MTTGTESWFTKQPSATKQRAGADVPGDVTTAQGPEHDGAYLEPLEKVCSTAQMSAEVRLQ